MQETELRSRGMYILCKEAIWMRFREFVRKLDEPTTIFEDNQGSLSMIEEDKTFTPLKTYRHIK